jgi:hypothetical protein
MKKIITLLSLLFILVSCSPALTDENLRLTIIPEEGSSPQQIGELFSNLNTRIMARYGATSIATVETNNELLIYHTDKILSVDVTAEQLKKFLSRDIIQVYINNQLVLESPQDFIEVCTNKDCSGISDCYTGASGTSCSFYFQTTLTDRAAVKMQKAINRLEIVEAGSRSFLSETMEIHVGEKFYQEIQINPAIQNTEMKQQSITGNVQEPSQELAKKAALNELFDLQTALTIETSNLTFSYK